MITNLTTTNTLFHQPTGNRADDRIRGLAPSQSVSRSIHRRRSFSLLRVLSLASLFINVRGQFFPATLELSSLDGTNGFTLNGDKANDRSGHSVSSAGDVNGDGVVDLLIGADGASPATGRAVAGKTYVVFGKPGLGAGGTIELSSLDGTNGFTLNGDKTYDGSGTSVSSAGDVNSDGVADLLIGAFSGDPATGRENAGKSYVVFGKPGLGAGGTIELSSLDGTNGFTLNGDKADDISGKSVSRAGDVNGDGVADFLIGAYYADPSVSRKQAGKSYVVFGKRGLGAGGTMELSSLDGTNGFTLNGDQANDNSGFSVSSAGDVNDDGVTDFLIGAPSADPATGRESAGKTYVVFGKRGIRTGSTIELSKLAGTDGFTLAGDKASDNSGWSVSGAGDVNGDGVSDLLIGAKYATPATGRERAGKTYVVFGKQGLGARGRIELSTLDGSNGFILNGNRTEDHSGHSVSSAGDVNGDGVADLLIGAHGRGGAGKAYVVFGRHIGMTTRSSPTTTGLPSSFQATSATSLLPSGGTSESIRTSAQLESTPVLSLSSSLPATSRKTSIAAYFSSRLASPKPLSLGLPLGIAGGACAVISSIAAAMLALRRRRQQPSTDPELAPQNAASEYAAIDSLGLPNQAPNYRELKLHPKGHTHYTPIDEVLRQHDEYESIQAANASGYAIWPQNPPSSDDEYESARLARAQESYDDIPKH